MTDSVGRSRAGAGHGHGRGDHVVVVGAGIAGLGAALAIGRAGCRVTVLERDPLPALADAEEAFRSERRGAPQVHQTHGFLARLQVILRDRFPDVLEDLHAVGGITLPMTTALGDPQPGDEDLGVLIVRRTTLEWVLRQAALEQDGVEIRTGAAVAGLIVDDDPHPTVTVPTVTGVKLDDGTVVAADTVVVAGGRRSPVPYWLGAIGVDVPETVHESGLMYVSRWYHHPDAKALLADPKLGGDLGFVKYLGVPGDGGTLSVTLAIRTTDTELRAGLADPGRFDRACRALPGPDRFFQDGPLEPIGGVRLMGGLLNRRRDFLDAHEQPTVLGVHVIGDAHTCTNPLYGRGCSLAMAQAVMLADAYAAHPDSPIERAQAYEKDCRRQILPWYEVSIQMDKAGADPAGFGVARQAGGEQGKAIGALFAAAATDPVLGRALMRFWNLLATPAELAADVAVMARMAEVMANPDAYPFEPPQGPSRRELLAAIGAPAGAVAPAFDQDDVIVIDNEDTIHA